MPQSCLIKWGRNMARIRTIKPELPQSESMGKVSRDARLLFILTWTLADDSGRLRGSSRMLASLLFPYDDDAPRLIDGWVSELVSEGCIQVYSAGGSTYIQICNWLIHQKIDKPSPSKIPKFVEPSRILANIRDGIKDQGPKDQGSKEGIKDHESQASPRDDLPEYFEEVWAAYPKRAGASKVDSLKQWKARIKAGATVKEILDGVWRYAAYVAASRTEDRFIKQPQTFLGPGDHFKSDWTVGARNARSGAETIEEKNTRVMAEFLGGDANDSKTIEMEV